MSDIEEAGSWPIEVAIHRIITAPDRHEASRIRNDVAMAAMYRKRPERDANACRDAFYERWGHELMQQELGPMDPLHYTGD